MLTFNPAVLKQAAVRLVALVIAEGTSATRPPIALLQIPAPEPESPAKPEQTLYQGVTDAETLQYQLDHLIDDIQHLETEHLPNQGVIMGKPCDCIAKASRDARRHAVETVPIAARAGQNPRLFADIAAWANEIIKIGDLESVRTGKYNERYLQEAGRASQFRKELERAKAGRELDCPTCDTIQDKLQEMRRNHGER